MKKLLILTLSALVTLLTSPVAVAQAPPGWGWVNKLGTYVPNATEQNSVAGLGRDAAGNLYLLGTYVGTPVLGGMPTTNRGESDVFLAKYDPAGTLVWLRTLQSTGFDGATALVVEPSGRCTLAGHYGGGPTGGNLFFMGFSTSSSLGGPAFFGLPASPLGYEPVPFLAAIDASGNLLWADTPSPTYGLGITALHRDGSGNCYLSVNTNYQSQLIFNGQNYPAIGIYDAILLKYNVAGTPAWARRVGASSGFTISGTVKTDATNALYWSVNHNRTLSISGQTIPFVPAANPVTQGSNALIKISSGNVIRWAKNGLLKSGNNNAQGTILSIEQATGAVYLSGGSYGGTITDQSNAFPLPIPVNNFGVCIAKCDTSGAVQGIRPFAYASTVPGGASWAAVEVLSFFPDATGYTALTNTAYAAQTVFPLDNTFEFNKNGMPCVTRYNYATNGFDWIRVGGLAGNYPNSGLGSHAVASAVDAVGNVFIAGTFTGTAQFGATTIASTTPFQAEIFLAKLDQSILTSTKAGTVSQAWSIFPNPATGTVQLAGLPTQARVRVFDVQGRQVREFLATGGTSTLAGLVPGLYLLQVSNTPAPYRSQRLVVQ
jgi:hypothetical protein